MLAEYVLLGIDPLCLSYLKHCTDVAHWEAGHYGFFSYLLCVFDEYRSPIDFLLLHNSCIFSIIMHAGKLEC